MKLAWKFNTSALHIEVRVDATGPFAAVEVFRSGADYGRSGSSTDVFQLGARELLALGEMLIAASERVGES
jgi:hypothetical protein